MMYLSFLFFCLATVSIATVSIDVRRRALLFGGLCLAVAYAVEVYGVKNHDWDYGGVDSVLRVSGIPIEILIGYFTAAFFLVILVTYLPRVSTEERRMEVMRSLLLGTGIVLVVYAYATRSMPILVGWAPLGMYGLSAARDRTVPLAVGMGAFFADWFVEGALTARAEYYSQGWDPTIGLVFMFAGMFISGVLTHEALTEVHLPRLLGRDGSISARRAEAIPSQPRGPLQGLVGRVLARKD